MEVDQSKRGMLRHSRGMAREGHRSTKVHRNRAKAAIERYQHRSKHTQICRARLPAQGSHQNVCPVGPQRAHILQAPGLRNYSVGFHEGQHSGLHVHGEYQDHAEIPVGV